MRKSKPKGDIKQIQKSFNELFDRFTQLNALFLSIGLLFGWFLTYYYGVRFNEWISWRAEDGNFAENRRFGVHSFGDFPSSIDLSRQTVLGQAPLTTGAYNVYPPLTNVMYRILGLLPYRMSLVFFFSLIIVLLILSFKIAFRNLNNTSLKFLSFLVFGLFTSPFLSALDRGNSIALLVPTLFFFFYYMKHDRPVLSAFYLSLAISLKIYPVLLIIPLLFAKRICVSIYSLVFFFLTNLLSLFVWGNPIQNASSLIKSLSNYRNISIDGNGLSFSFAQILVNSMRRVGVDAGIVDFVVNNSIVLSFSFLTLSMIAAFFSQPPFTYLYFLYCMQLVPLLSPSYTRIWTLIAFLLLVMEFSNSFVHRSRLLESKVWFLIIIFNGTYLTILPYFWPVNFFPTLSLFLFCFLILGKIFQGTVSFFISKSPKRSV